MSAAVTASLYLLVRHALAKLLTDLGARMAGRACLTAMCGSEWRDIADDALALAKHDDQRAAYPLAAKACEAMGRGQAGEAVDHLLALTGDDLPGWMLRAEEARAQLSGRNACAEDCARLDLVMTRLRWMREAWVRSGRAIGELDALSEIEAALDGAA